MKIFFCAVIALLCAIAVPVYAEQSIDGKKPLICATVEAINCERGEQCEKGLPEDIGAPQFMKVDFGKKEVIGPKRTTPIRLTETDDMQITLQGFEIGMGWTIAIVRSTGNMSATLAGVDRAIVLFGSCTPYPWGE
ncbi:MAG TPA: hypothetical protein VEI46_10790 [Thermodesulfovibrionales bacterium]|nr:hypothetical protein [Thermodesulfovibrionales bacterium]